MIQDHSDHGASKKPPFIESFDASLVTRPFRAIRVTRGGLEPSAIAQGLAKNGKKVPDQREKVPDNFSTKTSVFCDNHGIFRTYEINTSLPSICGPF